MRYLANTTEWLHRQVGKVVAVLESRAYLRICRRHHSAISWVASRIVSAGRACRSALRQRRSSDVGQGLIQSRSGSERKPVVSILTHAAPDPICLDMADHPEFACSQPGQTTPAWAPTRLPGMTPLCGFTESQGPWLRKGIPSHAQTAATVRPEQDNRSGSAACVAPCVFSACLVRGRCIWVFESSRARAR